MTFPPSVDCITINPFYLPIKGTVPKKRDPDYPKRPVTGQFGQFHFQFQFDQFQIG